MTPHMCTLLETVLRQNMRVRVPSEPKTRRSIHTKNILCLNGLFDEPMQQRMADSHMKTWVTCEGIGGIIQKYRCKKKH